MSQHKNQVVHQPFSVLNALVVKKLADTTLYTCGRFSYLKILEHALTYAALHNDQKLIHHRLHWPKFLLNLFWSFKKIVRGQKSSKYTLKSTVFIDPVRLNKSQDGKYYSIYMDKWINLVPIQNRTIIQRKREGRVASDYVLDEFAKNHGWCDPQESDVLAEVQHVRRKIESSQEFTDYEKQHIHSALAIFWEDFRFYYQVFKGKKTQRVVFICHYHNEGLLAACQVLGIESIELQHGLIARNDLYYVYHQQFKSIMRQAMFPDRIWVYGPYWRNILLEGSEFEPAQIQIAGDYLQRNASGPIDLGNKKNKIVVCAQKLMHKDYLFYLEKLSAYVGTYPGWSVVVKMHPLEPQKALYEQVKSYGFELVDMERTLDELLAESRIQISIYSTTFFDAIGFDIVNFSIQNLGSSSDYAADIVKESVAFPIEVNENPITKYLQTRSSMIPMGREEIYAPFRNALTEELARD